MAVKTRVLATGPVDSGRRSGRACDTVLDHLLIHASGYPGRATTAPAFRRRGAERVGRNAYRTTVLCSVLSRAASFVSSRATNGGSETSMHWIEGISIYSPTRSNSPSTLMFFVISNRCHDIRTKEPWCFSGKKLETRRSDENVPGSMLITDNLTDEFLT
ncbi:hypothetical protein EVAR_15821_1 [Eumeta japonica]|uniref:Uncharacterized protein n=1 Tax=Eumeta variegata TaxID=151549 RepID=A0A4C1TZF9_EUMVA|nr:hypothetical protein EVAR_15821_1 [Eumeta japonica]